MAEKDVKETGSENDLNFFEKVINAENEDDTPNVETATSGNHGVITDEIKAEARRLAESPKGLDIAAFQRKYKIHVMNVDELLKG